MTSWSQSVPQTATSRELVMGGKETPIYSDHNRRLFSSLKLTFLTRRFSQPISLPFEVAGPHSRAPISWIEKLAWLHGFKLSFLQLTRKLQICRKDMHVIWSQASSTKGRKYVLQTNCPSASCGSWVCRNIK